MSLDTDSEEGIRVQTADCANEIFTQIYIYIHSVAIQLQIQDLECRAIIASLIQIVIFFSAY